MSRAPLPFRATLRGRVTVLLTVLAVTLGLVGTGTALAARSASTGHDRVTSADIPNLGLVKNDIRAYYGDVVDSAGLHQASATSDYAHEVAGVERQAYGYLASRAHHGSHADARHAKRTPAIVLDVDDTSVLTYVYDANHDFGYDPVTNAVAVANGFPAVFGMPRLAQWASAHGYTIFFITGRPDTQHADTVRNLDALAYPASPVALSPQGDDLFTKPADPASRPYLHCDTDGNPACSTIEYKSSTRAFIESKGYDIVANLGDQFSDLTGGFADRAFKVPNPMYFLP